MGTSPEAPFFVYRKGIKNAEALVATEARRIVVFTSVMIRRVTSSLPTVTLHQAQW